MHNSDSSIIGDLDMNINCVFLTPQAYAEAFQKAFVLVRLVDRTGILNGKVEEDRYMGL